MADRSDVEAMESPAAAGESSSREIFTSIWSDSTNRDLFRTLGRSETASPIVVTDGSFMMPPIPGYSNQVPSAAPFLMLTGGPGRTITAPERAVTAPERAVTAPERTVTTPERTFAAPEGSLTSGAERPRASDAISATSERIWDVKPRTIEIGVLGDKGTSYRSADARGIGANHVDSDHLGIVREFAYQDARGELKSISGARLAQLMADTEVAGWRSTRTGSGADATTIVTAPDGRTTYHVDNLGRLKADAGSVRGERPRGVVSTDLGDGTRYDSPGPGGEVRRARTDKFGTLSHISVDSGSERVTFEPKKWETATVGKPVDLGHGWTAERGSFGGHTVPDSVRISHRDGSEYVVSPDGLLSYVSGPKGTDYYDRPKLAARLKAEESVSADGLETRYTTADRRGYGTNNLDVDHLGIVRKLTHTDAANLRRTFSMSTLDNVPTDAKPHALAGGWTASRTGSGEHMVTTITAPDSRTTYHLDSRGRIIPGIGSVDVPAGESVVAVKLRTGGHGHESVMADGSVARAVVTTDGALARIELSGRRALTITSTHWDNILRSPHDNGEIGNGWSISPVGSNANGGRIPPGSHMISHTDGTSFFIGPKGDYISALASLVPRTSRRSR